MQQVIDGAIQELEELEKCDDESEVKHEKQLCSGEHQYSHLSSSAVKHKSPVKSILKTSHNSPLNKLTVIDHLLDHDQLEETGLSGQVLIVSEAGDNVENTDDVSMTVTGDDGVKHHVQFSVQEEEEEDDPVEELGLLTQPQVITPEMEGVVTVSVNEQPEQVDESQHKVTRVRGDGVSETLFQCEMCSRTFSTPAALTSHRWQHTKPFQCEQCKTRFASKGNLVIHRRRHTGDRPFACSMCESKFTTKGNLKRHVQSHSGLKPWACNQCDGRFTEKKSLKIHMRKHTGEKPYVCAYCNKRFAQNSILKSHIAMHLDKRSHLCDLCGRGFRQKTQLRQHVLRHKGVKKYNCDMCESKFLTKADLDRHVKSHLGTKNFKCNLCSKEFTRQQTLNEHMNRHYGIKPYECKVCSQTFGELSSVYKHLKTHNIQKTDEEAENEIIIHKVSEDDEHNSLIKNMVIDLDSKISMENAESKVIYVNM